MNTENTENTHRTEDPGGRVEALLTTDRGGAPMRSVEVLELRRGSGVVGDRYAMGTGYWSDHRFDDLTLVEAEAAAEAAEALGQPVTAEMLRRNVVTRGVRLGELIGHRFRIGGAVLEGLRPCEPCRYLETLTGVAGLKASLRDRGGLRARVVEGGEIGVGEGFLLIR